jgi:epoxyqueuosine reductase
MRFAARAESDDPPLADLLQLDDQSFRTRFAGTPIKRTGRDRFTRNVLIAAGNSGDKSLLPQIRACLDDGSPLVRAMAVWALGRLCDSTEMASQRAIHLPRERDEAVLGEWRTSGDL